MMKLYLSISVLAAIAIAKSLSMDINEFFPDVNGNLTKVTWAHAVNNQALLNEVLGGDIMMLEADIVLGTLVNTEYIEKIPIMGHPPATTSDLSLKMFLEQVFAYNQNASDTAGRSKGVKLDFKTIEVFESSVEILNEMYSKMNYPVWINADIVRGPFLSISKPVDPTRFFNSAKQYSNSTLSIGWTTNYGNGLRNISYTEPQIADMFSQIKLNYVTHQDITFPVRAGIVANSLPQFLHLLDQVAEHSENAVNASLTVWSSAGDYVDVAKLRKLILTVGLDRVFVDVPKELHDQLRLDLDEHEYVKYESGRNGGEGSFNKIILSCILACVLAVLSL